MNLALFSNARYRISFMTTMKKSFGVFKYQRVFNRNNTGTRTGMLGCFFFLCVTEQYFGKLSIKWLRSFEANVK